MKTSILLLFLSLCLNGVISAQEDDLVFEYLEKKVRRVKMSRVEYIDMTYQDGLIIGKEYRNGPLVERRFYYIEIGKLDSVKSYWEGYNQQFITAKYYEYDGERRLKKVKSFEGVARKMSNLECFQYNEAGTLDTIVINSWDYSFYDALSPPAKSVGIITMNYDTLGRLVKRKNPAGFMLPWQEEFTYDDQGRVSVAFEYLAGLANRFTVVRFKYNNYGLLTREKHDYYDNTYEESDKGKHYRFLFKRRYEYYE